MQLGCRSVHALGNSRQRSAVLGRASIVRPGPRATNVRTEAFFWNNWFKKKAPAQREVVPALEERIVTPHKAISIEAVPKFPRVTIAIEEVSRKAHAGGILELLKIGALSVDETHPPLAAGANKPQRFIRVWLPPGHGKGFGANGQRGLVVPTLASSPSGGYPLLLLNDGQNLFGCPGGSASSWQAGETVSRLIEEGKIPPCVIVSVDHAGSWRSFEYCPYPPGSGVQQLRPEAASWSGGGVAAFTESILEQILPLAEERYFCTSDPARRVFGGSSFGGICGLWMAMLHPGRFGGFLVESPSFWMADGRAFSDVMAYPGPWPEKLFLGMGTEEYGSKGLNGRGPILDKHLLDTTEALSTRLRELGLGAERHILVLGPGARHNESAWAARLPAAVEFLCSSWRA